MERHDTSSERHAMMVLASLPFAWMTAWSDMLMHAWRFQIHLWRLQADFWAEPHRRWHDLGPRGAKLQSHYGRRATDVDVERI